MNYERLENKTKTFLQTAFCVAKRKIYNYVIWLQPKSVFGVKKLKHRSNFCVRGLRGVVVIMNGCTPYVRCSGNKKLEVARHVAFADSIPF